MTENDEELALEKIRELEIELDGRREKARKEASEIIAAAKLKADITVRGKEAELKRIEMLFRRRQTARQEVEKSSVIVDERFLEKPAAEFLQMIIGE